MQNDVCKIVARVQEMKEKKEARLNNIDRLANMIDLCHNYLILLL